MARGAKKICWACMSQNTGTSRKPPDHQARRSHQSLQSGGFQANFTPKIMSLLIITLFYVLSIFNTLCKKFRHFCAEARVRAPKPAPHPRLKKTTYPPTPCRHDLLRHGTARQHAIFAQRQGATKPPQNTAIDAWPILGSEFEPVAASLQPTATPNFVIDCQSADWARNPRLGHGICYVSAPDRRSECALTPCPPIWRRALTTTAGKPSPPVVKHELQELFR